jgi:hypothetical protein
LRPRCHDRRMLKTLGTVLMLGKKQRATCLTGDRDRCRPAVDEPPPAAPPTSAPLQQEAAEATQVPIAAADHGRRRDAGVTSTSVIGTACTVRRQCRVDCSRCS